MAHPTHLHQFLVSSSDWDKSEIRWPRLPTSDCWPYTPAMSTFDPRKLTWAALLARWVNFARSAVAMPDDTQGRAWKSAVPDIIALQAVTMALGELDQLPTEERALGLDRAQVLIDRHGRNLRSLFPNELHPMLAEMIDEADAALSRGRAVK